MTDKVNLLENLPIDLKDEVFQTLLSDGKVRLERIVSHGQTTPEGEWYDQDWHEWVVVLQGRARLRFEDQENPVHLKAGDSISLPAHLRHRVEWTDPDQVTIWLAVHWS